MTKSKQEEKEKNHPLSSDLPSISTKEVLILEMLCTSGRDLYGLEIVEASGGKLKRGTIYVTLQRMAEKGFVDSKQEARTAPEIGIARRLYHATNYGQRTLVAYRVARSVFRGDLALGDL